MTFDNGEELVPSNDYRYTGYLWEANKPMWTGDVVTHGNDGQKYVIMYAGDGGSAQDPPVSVGIGEAVDSQMTMESFSARSIRLYRRAQKD